MKTVLFAAATCLVLVSYSDAVVIDFGDSAKYPGPEIAGSDGWTCSTTTPYFSFLVGVGDRNWGSLGGFYDFPLTPEEVTLSHTIGVAAKTASLVTRFFINSSSEQYPGREAFGFRFGGGTNGLFEIKFVPNYSDILQPGLMDIFVGVGGGSPSPSGKTIFDDTMYSLSVEWNEGSLGALEMTATVENGSNRHEISAALPGEAEATWNDFGVVWYAAGGTPGASDNFSPDNFIAFDGIAVTGGPVSVPVPEPCGAMASFLTMAMGGAVTMRRRRQT